ncbi:MAG: helicase-associated domain-containing protein [Chloroflexota bacterium]|nr:helicase-associated domain-containing protein [Chloroflexota bacterium]
MKDLYRCLDEYTPTMLHAISDPWQILLAEDEPRQMAVHLAETMQTSPALKPLLDGLSPEADEALIQLLRQGGSSPSRHLSVRYGNIRRFGPLRMERERPWLQPSNALEELFYKGLLYRAYGSVDDHYGEILFIPQELLVRLYTLKGDELEVKAQSVPTPERVEADGLKIMEDLFAILVYMRREQPPIPSKGQDPLTTLEEMALLPRLLGEATPQRIRFLWHLVWKLDLALEVEGVLQPSLCARDWLQLSDAQRMQTLYQTWRDDTEWNELEIVPSLRCEDISPQRGLVNARRNLLRALNDHAPNGWFSLEAFIDILNRHYPDYLRPDADFQAWDVRDAETKESLRGFESWYRVEGALAEHILKTSLRWLGVVDVGYHQRAKEPSALSITALGRGLLNEQRSPEEAGAPSPPPPLATVNDDLAVEISCQNTLYERYQLERFAEWQRQNDRALYRITEESLYKGLNTDIKVEQIIRFLQRITGDAVPSHVLQKLRAWGARFGRVSIREVVLFQTVDAETMRQLQAHPGIGEILGKTISPAACLVAKERVPELVQQLKTLGIWPKAKRAEIFSLGAESTPFSD